METASSSSPVRDYDIGEFTPVIVFCQLKGDLGDLGEFGDGVFDSNYTDFPGELLACSSLVIVFFNLTIIFFFSFGDDVALACSKSFDFRSFINF